MAMQCMMCSSMPLFTPHSLEAKFQEPSARHMTPEAQRTSERPYPCQNSARIHGRCLGDPRGIRRSGTKSSNGDGTPYLKRPRGADGTLQLNNIIGETIITNTKYSLSNLLSEGAAHVRKMCAICKQCTCASVRYI